MRFYRLLKNHGGSGDERADKVPNNMSARLLSAVTRCTASGSRLAIPTADLDCVPPVGVDHTTTYEWHIGVQFRDRAQGSNG